MRSSLLFCCVLLAAAASAQSFRLGVNSTVSLPANALTNLTVVQLATDAQGEVYILENGLTADQSKGPAAYLIKLVHNRVVYQQLLPFDAYAFAVDPAGNAYFLIFASPNQSVVKLAPDGVTVLYTVNFGSKVVLNGLAVDAGGRAYVTGSAVGNAIQTTPHALQPSPASSSSSLNAFVIRLTAQGGTDYATYLGGASMAEPAAIAADNSGSAYVIGTALSAAFPTTPGAYLSASAIPNFTSAPFLTKLSPTGTALVYSTFADASPLSAFAVTVDPAGGAIVALGGLADASRILRFTPQGGLAFAQSVAAAGPPYGVALDSAGNTYLSAIAAGNFAVLNSISACQTSPSASLTVLGPGSDKLAATYIPDTAQIAALAVYGSSVYIAATRQLKGAQGPVFLTVLTPDATASVVGLACVASAASFDSAGISGGELVSLFGQGLGPATGMQPAVEPQAGVPKQAAGVQVTFNGAPAPLLYLQDSQINAIAPWELPSGSTVTVCAAYNQVVSNCIARTVLDQHPGVFTFDGVHAAAINQDGSYNSPSHPAPVGTVVSIYATGLGAITPLQPDGSFIGLPLPTNVLPDDICYLYDTFFIGSVAVTLPALYGGPAPFEVAGVSQVNFQVINTQEGSGFQPPYVLQAGHAACQVGLFSGGSNGFYLYTASQ